MTQAARHNIIDIAKQIQKATLIALSTFFVLTPPFIIFRYIRSPCKAGTEKIYGLSPKQSDFSPFSFLIYEELINLHNTSARAEYLYYSTHAYFCQ